jgi:hypothetical protein
MSLSQRAQSLGANDDRHAVMDLGNQLIGISGDETSVRTGMRGGGNVGS